MKLLFLAVIFGAGFIIGQYFIGTVNITGFVSAVSSTIQGFINPNSTLLPGQCLTNADCNATSYCSLTSCAGTGFCSAKPENCPMIWNPVCGCNGADYDNACLAAMAGVSVSSEGSCS